MTTLALQSSRFGDIQVSENDIITFLEPILGFESFKRFILLNHGENTPFHWLQSVEEPTLAFVLTNPASFQIPYDFTLPPAVTDLLGLDADSVQDLVILNIVTVPEENPAGLTANLLAPVLIHSVTRKAAQVILADSGFSTKVPLMQREGG
jgi:flagellar assembly factor FliW